MTNNPQTRIPNERLDHVQTETEKIIAELKPLLPELNDNQLKMLARFVLDREHTSFYRGARTNTKLLALFKRAAEAKLPERIELHDSINKPPYTHNRNGFNACLSQATAALRSVSMEDVKDE